MKSTYNQKVNEESLEFDAEDRAREIINDGRRTP